jgi:transcriptional regulator with PAS, ATPase and Fis domain
MILGETRTGNEILAQANHNASPRKNQPIVGANIASLSESLLESELFGYEGGSFTGAKKDGRSGLFEQAHNGTIFLDEIGDASPSIQNRLLRVLQERQILRVGGEQIISLNLRVIAATNKDLGRLIETGEFREDLYYRLNVLPIRLPPLRDRVDDIEWLSRTFIKEMSHKLRRQTFTFSPDALDALKSYQWPGNIRELRNTIEYLAHVCDDVVCSEELPFLVNRDCINTDQQLGHDYDELLHSLQKRGFKDELIALLRFLSDDTTGSIGRHRMMDYLNRGNFRLSEPQLRYRQKLLKEMGLIYVHRGRKGSEITKKGENLLEYLNQIELRDSR